MYAMMQRWIRLGTLGEYNKYFIGIPFKTISEAKKYRTILINSCNLEGNDFPPIVKFTN